MRDVRRLVGRWVGVGGVIRKRADRGRSRRRARRPAVHERGGIAPCEQPRCGRLHVAFDAGELPAEIAPADLARTLAAVIQGGYVLARAMGDQEPMDAAVRGAISLLDAAQAAAH